MALQRMMMVPLLGLLALCTT
eukprot:COSAG06_NODE_64914_length_258_cov_0.654088_1_plen_20_part_01